MEIEPNPKVSTTELKGSKLKIKDQDKDNSIIRQRRRNKKYHFDQRNNQEKGTERRKRDLQTNNIKAHTIELVWIPESYNLSIDFSQKLEDKGYSLVRIKQADPNNIQLNKMINKQKHNILLISLDQLQKEHFTQEIISCKKEDLSIVVIFEKKLGKSTAIETLKNSRVKKYVKMKAAYSFKGINLSIIEIMNSLNQKRQKEKEKEKEKQKKKKKFQSKYQILQTSEKNGSLVIIFQSKCDPRVIKLTKDINKKKKLYKVILCYSWAILTKILSIYQDQNIKFCILSLKKTKTDQNMIKNTLQIVKKKCIFYLLTENKNILDNFNQYKNLYIQNDWKKLLLQIVNHINNNSHQEKNTPKVNLTETNHFPTLEKKDIMVKTNVIGGIEIQKENELEKEKKIRMGNEDGNLALGQKLNNNKPIEQIEGYVFCLCGSGLSEGCLLIQKLNEKTNLIIQKYYSTHIFLTKLQKYAPIISYLIIEEEYLNQEIVITKVFQIPREYKIIVLKSYNQNSNMTVDKNLQIADKLVSSFFELKKYIISNGTNNELVEKINIERVIQNKVQKKTLVDSIKSDSLNIDTTTTVIANNSTNNSNNENNNHSSSNSSSNSSNDNNNSSSSSGNTNNNDVVNDQDGGIILINQPKFTTDLKMDYKMEIMNYFKQNLGKNHNKFKIINVVKILGYTKDQEYVNNVINHMNKFTKNQKIIPPNQQTLYISPKSNCKCFENKTNKLCNDEKCKVCSIINGKISLSKTKFFFKNPILCYRHYHSTKKLIPHTIIKYFICTIICGQPIELGNNTPEKIPEYSSYYLNQIKQPSLNVIQIQDKRAFLPIALIVSEIIS
ncbi:zcchc10 protein [Anaeramoeba flamelloides]|uniref:Zcchc10 protein n=1 Tax=Anaeramoeba flamelloides TaxID=1746091 RepID=A0ABQ8Z3G1_9EUKA|nr:zcchc10 protein [Anaeramoeba flamelloides]